jgi:hypothetical protein
MAARAAAPTSTELVRRALPALLALTVVMIAPNASAWDSRTHRLITRLAVDALPPSALKNAMVANEGAVEQHTEDPDTVLRRRFGRAEERHHFIDLEDFGRDPFAVLSPDYAVMRSRISLRTLRRAGSLPWTIARVSDDLARAWRDGTCAEVMRQSGYLAHYVGDATQPLHTTKHFDGYYGDRGVHSRFEGAADHDVGQIAKLAAPDVHVAALDSPWSAAIAEIRDSHVHVNEVIDADRRARPLAYKGAADYDRLLLTREQPLIAHQVAEAASTLASLWLFEWKRAGSPELCTRRAQASEPYWNRSAPQS